MRMLVGFWKELEGECGIDMISMHYTPVSSYQKVNKY